MEKIYIIPWIFFFLFCTIGCKTYPHSNSETIFGLNDVDREPHFVGGEKSMWKYIYKNNKVISKDEDFGVDQRASVMISFIVEKDGSLSNIHWIGGGYKNKFIIEALRIIEGMPKWQPAVLNKKQVRCKKIIIISFPPIY